METALSLPLTLMAAASPLHTASISPLISASAASRSIAMSSFPLYSGVRSLSRTPSTSFLPLVRHRPGAATASSSSWAANASRKLLPRISAESGTGIKRFAARQVCVFLLPSRTSSPDADGDGNVGLPSSPAEEEEEDLLLGPIARDLAKELSIPLIIPECPAEEGGGASSAFGHRLRIVPYARGSMRTYAVAIQPSPPIEAASRRRQKRRRKKDDDPAMRPFYVEFVPPPGSRVGKVMGGGGGGGGTELLLRAVAPQRRQGQGKHSETGMIVWDLTAGFGRDAALVAAGGAEAVVMIERDPVVAALLRDGLRRLCLVADSGLGDDCDDETVGRAAYLSERLSLEEGDGSDAARRLLSEGAEDRNENDNDKSRERRRRGIGRRPDVCYLDPMFPPRTKS